LEINLLFTILTPLARSLIKDGSLLKYRLGGIDWR
jgi:hypothetical protein